MEIVVIDSGKKDFLDLLLLADEQESMIEKYLDRGTLFALYDDGLKTVCVVTDEGGGMLEIQNLATYQQFQGQGYACRIISHVCQVYSGRFSSICLGTGDSPSILRFYERRGFSFSHRLENYFTEHYDKPIFEEGMQLKDKIYLKMDI